MSAPEEQAPPLPQPAKVDPESLVLRGRPRPVVRFRRGVVIGGVAAASAILVGLTWVALEPVTFRSVAGEQGGRPFERNTLEAMAGAPRDYRDVPRLGPPLPGDLGRPILEQQREQGEAPLKPAAVADPGSGAGALRQQRAAAEQAARASSLVVQLGGTRQASFAEAAAAPEQRQAEATAGPTAGAPEPKVELGIGAGPTPTRTCLLRQPRAW